MWDLDYYRVLTEKLKEATALVAGALAVAGHSERVEMIDELIEANELGAPSKIYATIYLNFPARCR